MEILRLLISPVLVLVDVDFIRSDIKRFVSIFSISLLFVGSCLSQNCQIILNSGESFFDLELSTLSEDTLIVIKPEGDFMPLHVDEIKEIYVERKIDMGLYLKKMATGTIAGAVIGSVAGLVFSELALKWLSNDDDPKGWISNRDLSGGDEAIVRLFTGMSTLMGIFHGCDWALKISKNTQVYDFSNKRRTEKIEIVKEILDFQKDEYNRG